MWLERIFKGELREVGTNTTGLPSELRLGKSSQPNLSAMAGCYDRQFSKQAIPVVARASRPFGGRPGSHGRNARLVVAQTRTGETPLPLRPAVWGSRAAATPRSRRSQVQDESFPLFPNRGHVVFAQHALQEIVSRRVIFGVGDELAVELHEQSLFLQIIAEIPGLGVILAVTGALIAAIKLPVGHRSELSE